MIRTRYHKLKLFLVPFNAGLAIMAGASAFPEWVRVLFGALSASGTALYGLINEIPHDYKAEEKAELDDARAWNDALGE